MAEQARVLTDSERRLRSRLVLLALVLFSVFVVALPTWQQPPRKQSA